MIDTIMMWVSLIVIYLGAIGLIAFSRWSGDRVRLQMFKTIEIMARVSAEARDEEGMKKTEALLKEAADVL